MDILNLIVKKPLISGNNFPRLYFIKTEEFLKSSDILLR